MPEIKILIAIGFVVFQIIRFFLKKSKETDSKTSETLDEMIERMNNSPKKAEQNHNTFKKSPIIATEYVEESPSLSNNKYKAYDAYQGNNVSNINYDRDSNASQNLKEGKYKEFDSKLKRNEYLEKIKDPKSFKDAFVLNEILNNKYLD
jgi:hypothetical protein